MDPPTHVCPFCGNPPGPGIFCASCGRNLSAVERLPTAAEREVTSERLHAAAERFLEQMHRAGDPDTVEMPSAPPRAFRRRPKIRGWIVLPVDREDLEEPRRYEPGLLLSVEGTFHRLDSELRGWGQRDFPSYEHSVTPEPTEPPVDERVIDYLERNAP